MDQFHASDFDAVQQLCERGAYQYIIVGSGMGGGILADDLAKRGKKVLLIEKGGLNFSTHVCNTARPDFSRGKADSPEGNEVIYNKLKAWVQLADDSDAYVGGPLYGVGGRSVIWGLWVPRAFPSTLDAHFPAAISQELQNQWYDKAFSLLTKTQKDDKVYPEGRISSKDIASSKAKLKEAIQLYLPTDSDVAIGPLASQFSSKQVYGFPHGAYSTVEALLNRIYSGDENLTLLTGVEVLGFDHVVVEGQADEKRLVTALTVRHTSTERIHKLLTKGAQVILSAGTLCTASIALRSGLRDHCNLVGRGLMDHAIWASRFAIQRSPDDSLKDPLLLQTKINICNTTALLSVTFNNNFFLAGSSNVPIHQYFQRNGDVIPAIQVPDALQGGDYDTVAVLIEFGAPLNDDNAVFDTASPNPVIRIRRNDTHDDEDSKIEMQILITRIRNHIIRRVLEKKCPLLDLSGLDTIIGKNPTVPSGSGQFSLPLGDPLKMAGELLKAFAVVLAPRPILLGCGIFAHEVGTMRMDGPKPENAGVVDENLKVHQFSNLHACDLSVFPYSIESNPAITLAALALRLANRLSSRVGG
jgi:choline dehydrogenase-like flavoprotein